MNITDEFEFLMEEIEETTYEEDSNSLIEEANNFMEKTSLYPDRTYQGIAVTAIKESLFIKETDIMPWNHVGMTIDINKLKDISGEKLTELYIPTFVEEIESIGDRAGTEFGYNQSHRNNLKFVNIPRNIIVIAPNTFAFYKNLEKVKFEENCKLMYLGKQAFAYCEKLKVLDLRNCIYLDEIKDNTFINSGIEILKISNTIQKISPIHNTNINTIFLNNKKFSLEEFNNLLIENNGIFWDNTR